MNKYGAKKVTVDGIEFDSRREASRYSELLVMQRAGLISELKRQEEFILIPKCGKERPAKYHADFSYIDTATGKKVVEDVKSRATKTKDYILRRKLMNWRYDIQIVEV
jgi:hypothetical protein